MISRLLWTALPLAWLAACGARGATQAPGPGAVEFTALPPAPAHGNGRLELRGLDAAVLEAWPASESQLTVRAERSGREARAMLGRTRVEGDALVFEPRFPFERGLAYRALLQSSGAEPRTWDFSFAPLARVPSTSVRRVYPSSDVLPANVLRFYVHFSAPMRRGEAYRNVRLLDAEGETIEGAFLELEPELWDPDTTRLTLLIDPGRIKRGLLLHEQLGPVLHPERRYALAIDADWRDARGTALVGPYQKSFRTVAEDMTPPDPRHWSLSAPPAGTRSALRAELDEALDHALLERVLSVRGPEGEPLAGTPEASEAETIWTWVPAAPWGEGRHELVVDTVLEDLAGNGVGRPFEVDRIELPGFRYSEESLTLPFVVAAR